MATYTAEKTVVGLFDDMTDAQRAVSDLEHAGVMRKDINIIAGNETGRYNQYTEAEGDKSAAKGAAKGAGAGAAIGGGLGLVAGLTALAIPGFGPIIAAGPIAAALTGAGIGAAAGGLIGGLTNAGVPHEHAEYYAEGVRRGGVLVTVRVDESRADRVADIMDDAGARDVEEKSREWRAGGWTGPSLAGTGAGYTAGTRDLSAGKTGEQHIPVVQEDVQVGKRQVARGGVRIFSEVRERPVEENVTLREEHVSVERRPVDRPAGAGDFAAFREGTIELVETAEEPVVEKTARVKEEVVVKKDVTQRKEKVRDTVRSTDVKVDRLEGDFDRDFRSDFDTRYAGRNYQYERYQPAYEFGSSYAVDERYRNRDWAQVEPDLRRDWETRGHGTWQDFKDSIRYGWDRVRGRR